ncbi:MAG: hypothetical protein JWM43_2861 [Acidobacteriaceae bacterium]|nr:hypothetical protein [Acidobacteriaceae bacterium]
MERFDGDKFEFKVEKLPEQIHWKLYRAKQHLIEFEREASSYMNVSPSGPGEMIHAPESTPEKPIYIYAPEKPVPAIFGLIAGDYLHNLRSVFDYLVWQLILVNGGTPHETYTAFPICKSAGSFDKARKKRLVGVSKDAIDLIEALQPFPERNPGGKRPQTIHILDELNNANKHRQVLSTKLATILKPDGKVPFPHIELEVIRHRGENSIPGERLLAYLAFESRIVRSIEVTATLSALMDWVGFEILPQFEKFF